MKRFLVRLAVAFPAWTAVALLDGLHRPLYALTVGRALPSPSAFVESLVSCWLWALLTPAMLWMADSYPLDRRCWRRSLPLHLLGAAASVVLSAAGMYALAWVGYERAPSLRAEAAAELFIDVYSYAAVVALGHALAYHRRLAAQRLRASQLEAQLLGARLEALEARLQPHFLFNALNTVSSLIRTGQPAAAVRAVARLGDLLRDLLRDDGQEVPLAQELDFVDRYLELERARFGDRLATSVLAGPEVLGAMVPRLVLQPLVENALRHGIEPSAAPGRLVVQAVRDGPMLRIEVRDSGAGSGAAAPSTGVGLAGTRARLAHLYGDRHELALVSRAGETVARLALPFRQEAAA